MFPVVEEVEIEASEKRTCFWSSTAEVDVDSAAIGIGSPLASSSDSSLSSSCEPWNCGHWTRASPPRVVPRLRSFLAGSSIAVSTPPRLVDFLSSLALLAIDRPVAPMMWSVFWAYPSSVSMLLCFVEAAISAVDDPDWMPLVINVTLPDLADTFFTCRCSGINSLTALIAVEIMLMPYVWIFKYLFTSFNWYE